MLKHPRSFKCRIELSVDNYKKMKKMYTAEFANIFMYINRINPIILTHYLPVFAPIFVFIILLTIFLLLGSDIYSGVCSGICSGIHSGICNALVEVIL